MNLNKALGPIVSASSTPVASPILERLRALEFPSIVSFLNPDIESSSIQDYHLGNEILNYQPAASPPFPPDALQVNQDGYVVLKGQVRLLSHSQQLQRQVSTTVLRAGDIFGNDHLFCATPSAYTAIATSFCQVAPIATPRLLTLLAQYPELAAYLKDRVRQRMQLGFFKTCTPLHTLPSKTLCRLLLPRIREIQVMAGEHLMAVMATHGGYFWLGSGQVSSPSQPDFALPVGSSWSNHLAALADSVAQTPLTIYQLQFEPWETADLFPILNRLL